MIIKILLRNLMKNKKLKRSKNKYRVKQFLNSDTFLKKVLLL